MMNNELNKTWLELESNNDIGHNYIQKMICIESLYRVYIGVIGIPGKRFLDIEIPINQIEKFTLVTTTKGFIMNITEPTVKHDGYAACILQASSVDQNEVFSIVAKDILNSLEKEKSEERYVEILKERIEKWRDFFKEIHEKKLSNNVLIGLMGELKFLNELLEHEIYSALDWWNGPIKAAQDFQDDRVAVEIKATSNLKLDNVYISNEVQLDSNDREKLFLIAYRLERDDASGKSLPEMIEIISKKLSETQRNIFRAKLLCLGYDEENSESYSERFVVKESKCYDIKANFPCLTRKNIPLSVHDIKYKLELSHCEQFKIDLEDVIRFLEEYIYG